MEPLLSQPDIRPKYKIWEYSILGQPLADDPRTLDYKTGLTTRLHPVMTFAKGELTQVKYFSDYDDESSLILCVDIEWVREEGVLKQRVETRKYVLEGEGIEYGEAVKISVKHYDTVTSAKADVKRRSNIISDLTARAEDFGVLSDVQELFRSLDNELNAYISTGDNAILSKILTYEGQWLETPVPNTPYTLRQVILDGLTI